MTPEEREDIVFICAMRSNYTEDCLKALSDEELLRIFNKTGGNT